MATKWKPFDDAATMGRAANVIRKARKDGVTIDKGNVVDLLLDNLPELDNTDEAKRILKRMAVSDEFHF